MIFPVIFPLSDPLVSSPWLLVTSTWRRHGSATRPASAQFLSCFVSENREYHGIPQNSIFDRENDYHGGSWGVPRYLIFGQNQVYLQPLWKNGCKIASNRAEGRRNMKHVQGTSQMKTMYFIVVCARQKTKVRCPLIPATFGPDSRIILIYCTQMPSLPILDLEPWPNLDLAIMLWFQFHFWIKILFQRMFVLS